MKYQEEREELDALFASGLFLPKSNPAQFLRYVCDQYFAETTDQIKEYNIAIDAFGRRPDFNPREDAVVRVEAHRVRRRLKQYYEAEGATHLLQIVIPSGQYIPQFVRKSEKLSPLGVPAQIQSVETPLAPDSADLRKKRFLMISGVLAAALLTVITVLWFKSRVAVNKPLSATSSVPAIVDPTEEIRILAGSPKDYVDRFGKTWKTDQFFHAGSIEPGPKDFLGAPPDPSLFRTMRLGEFSYDIPLKPGVYELRLFFAEPLYRSGFEVGNGGEAKRRFNIALNGKQILEQFDVVSDSGFAPVDVRAFKDVTPAPDGMLHLKFSSAWGDPFLNALELIPGIPGKIRPIRIRANEFSYTDHDGNVWSPDNYFIGGSYSTHKLPVENTHDPELYAVERYGNFSYAIPVPPGTYSVTLHFAETWFRPDTDGPDKGNIGSRLFDVYCNGVSLLKSFDILKEAGGSFRALKKTFRGLSPNGQGKILISFSPIKNYASVKAIEIIDESK